jgi:hypothetical protein
MYREREREKKKISWILGILPSGRPLHVNERKEG